MITDEDRNRFNSMMEAIGIDPENPKNDAERLALPTAFNVFCKQQSVIYEIEDRIARFKHAFESL